MCAMRAARALVLLLAVGQARQARRFPAGFRFGAGTSAHQAEGAWNESGKSESVWDRVGHRPRLVLDGSAADVAADSYHQVERDVRMARQLGLHFYRFSISWSRLLPHGTDDFVNEAGVSYYTSLIDGLFRSGIEPMVTLYHWDLPQSLEELGGWKNPLIVDWFEDYSRVVFDLFADRVKMWITMNEPIVMCVNIPKEDIYVAPLPLPTAGEYACCKNALLAHARVYRLFDREYRPRHGGIISFSDMYIGLEKNTNTKEEEEWINIADELYNGMFSHAVYSKEGGWPKALEERIANRSASLGYLRSRLPELSREEIDYIRGTYDFCGFNYYVSKYVRPSENGTLWSFLSEMDLDLYPDPSWTRTAAINMELHPVGMRNTLRRIKQLYDNPHIIITENGCATRTGLLDDQRVSFLHSILDQVLDAIYLDGVNVTHYTYWSLMDVFQWVEGVSVRYGLYQVNFTDPVRPTTARKSALVYKEIIRSKVLDPLYNPLKLITV